MPGNIGLPNDGHTAFSTHQGVMQRALNRLGSFLKAVHPDPTPLITPAEDVPTAMVGPRSTNMGSGFLSVPGATVPTPPVPGKEK